MAQSYIYFSAGNWPTWTRRCVAEYSEQAINRLEQAVNGRGMRAQRKIVQAAIGAGKLVSEGIRLEYTRLSNYGFLVELSRPLKVRRRVGKGRRGNAGCPEESAFRACIKERGKEPSEVWLAEWWLADQEDQWESWWIIIKHLSSKPFSGALHDNNAGKSIYT